MGFHGGAYGPGYRVGPGFHYGGPGVRVGVGIHPVGGRVDPRLLGLPRRRERVDRRRLVLSPLRRLRVDPRDLGMERLHLGLAAGLLGPALLTLWVDSHGRRLGHFAGPLSY